MDPNSFKINRITAWWVKSMLICKTCSGFILSVPTGLGFHKKKNLYIKLHILFYLIYLYLEKYLLTTLLWSVWINSCPCWRAFSGIFCLESMEFLFFTFHQASWKLSIWWHIVDFSHFTSKENTKYLSPPGSLKIWSLFASISFQFVLY